MGSIALVEAIDLMIELAAEQPVTNIFIDALDECDIRNQHDLIANMQRLLADAKGLIKVFISSRNDRNLVDWLSEYPNTEMAMSKTKDDIEHFVKVAVDQRVNNRPRRLLPNGPISDSVSAEVKKRLSNQAQGM